MLGNYWVTLGSETKRGMVRLVTIGIVKLSGTALLSALGHPPRLFSICAGGAGGERRNLLRLAAPLGLRFLQESAKE